MKRLLMALVAVVLSTLALSGCTTSGPSTPPPSATTPVATNATTSATPTASDTPSPTQSAANPFTNWVELTPSSASGEGRVLMACSEAHTATYWLYNLKAKASIGLTVGKSPDCATTNIVTPTTAVTSTMSPSATPTEDPYTQWVEVTPKNVADRRTFVFCSAAGTGFYWLYDQNKDNPIGGAIMGQVIIHSEDCKR